MSAPQRIDSRANPRVVHWRRLAGTPAAYRDAGEVWIEGEHLCAACVEAGARVSQAILTDAGWRQATLRAMAATAEAVSIVAPGVMAGIGGLASPPPVAFIIPWRGNGTVRAGQPSLVLDRLQDAGNVGTLLRSAAAFGFEQVIALAGTAALWSPKVMRAAMGAHFVLSLVECAGAAQLDALGIPVLATSSHAAEALHDTVLAWPCAWLLGNEGQGIDAALLARCERTLRIAQPGGGESLNVGAAGAICLYETARQRLLRASVRT